MGYPSPRGTGANKNRVHRGAQMAQQCRLGIFRSRVTILQQIDCNPQFRIAGLSAPVQGNLFLFEFCNLVREPRHFSARRIAMHDALLRRANQSRLGFCQGRGCLAAIAGGNRLLDFTDRGAHARAPGFINDGSARGLARGFLCGFRIGHTYCTLEMVTGSGAYRGLARYRQRRPHAAAATDRGAARPCCYAARRVRRRV